MKRAIRTSLALGLLSFWVAVSAGEAKEISGLKFPDEMQVEGKAVVLNGAGFREGGVNRTKAYAVGLYLESKSKNHLKILRSKEIKHLVLKFVANVSRESLVEVWSVGFKQHGGEQIGGQNDRLKTLNSYMISLNQGDAAEFTHVAGKGLSVMVKGDPKGVIEGDDFARVFFSIWLDSPPLEFKLRNNLLGRE